MMRKRMRSSRKTISRWRQPWTLRTRVDFHDIAVSLLAFSLLQQHTFLTVVVLLSSCFSFLVRCCITTTSAVVIGTSVTPSRKTSLLTNSSPLCFSPHWQQFYIPFPVWLWLMQFLLAAAGQFFKFWLWCGHYRLKLVKKKNFYLRKYLTGARSTPSVHNLSMCSSKFPGPLWLIFVTAVVDVPWNRSTVI